VILKPLHPHHLLSWMEIPAYPKAYILGSFARHVTIYSQQMRAFNLVDALCKTGQLSNRVSVAVVGGGIAGLTAAAAAAVRGAEVTIIERDEDFFPIQRHAGKRYLHPHIYDWPLYELKEGQEDVANFPFLGWKADEAEVVFRELKKGWKDFCSNFKEMGRPKKLMGARFIGLSHKSERDCLELTVREKDRPGPTLITAQIVILALGFGREIERADIQKYWDEAPFDSVPRTTLKWLVSGYGDGGLTDLMRLCIKDFRHDEFVKKFAGDSGLIRKLKGLLSDHKSKNVRSTFEELYEQLDNTSLIASSNLRSNTDVTFNAPDDYLESDGSSILNRFIVFQLEKLDKFKRQGGWVKSPIPSLTAKDKSEEYEYKIEFTDKDKKTVINTLTFDRLILRHGPESPFGEKEFSEIWEASGELREKWKRQSQSNDRTRIQIWDPADYDLKKAPNPIMIEDVPDGGVDLRCLILESTNRREQGRLAELIKAALISIRKEIKPIFERKQSDPDINLEFEVVRINEALSSQKEYNRTVRMLCQADVAVIDVTKYESGVMLFLGLRSAARRGVTLVTTNQKLVSSEWSKLPFNLKELYPLSVWPRTSDINSPEHPIRIIGTTAARALRQYHSLSFYQDLPAYEAVRRFETTPGTGAQTILWLCPFDAGYKPCEAYIQNGFIAEYGDEATEDNKKKYRLERITEIVSPQLVTQRLYSAIRRTGLCLVDWSLWSPNVFFEFGVRVAVNSMGPVCLLAKGLKDFTEAQDKKNRANNDSAPTEEVFAQREALKKLFHPIEYGQEGEEQKLFQEIRERHLEMQDYETPGRAPSPVPPAFGAFAYNHTYKLLGRYLPLRNEPGASPAHEFLKYAADALVGVDLTKDQSLPVLYASANKDLDRQARDAAKELLIAAWYYLSKRYPLDELKQQPALLEHYTALSLRLDDLLEWSDSEKDGKLRRRVERILNCLENNHP
jgi:FAD dependent oxidoreductase